MRKQLLVVLLGTLVLLGGTVQAWAQEERPVRVGVGAGINFPSFDLILADDDLIFLPDAMVDWYIPVRISDTFIVEPAFSISTASDTVDPEEGDTLTDSASVIQLGIGLLYPIRLTEATRANVGARTGIVLVSADNEYTGADNTVETQSMSRSDFFFGLAVGGDYFLSPSFSLGGEVTLTYYSIGDPEYTDTASDDDDTSTTSGSVISTGAQLLVRWYFL